MNEHYDSKTAPAALGVDMAMKNIIYDLYSKDLSQKVRSARKSLMKKGDYIAPFAIYGYTNKVEKKRLVIDPPAAEVVRRMFEYSVNGASARAIAIRLNKEGVLPPNAYNKSKSTAKTHYIPMDSTAIWTGDIVRRIPQDERYTGKMVCGKYEKRNRKTTLLPKEKWVITPGTHEALVSDELFQKVQAMFRTRKEIIRPDKPKSILVGMLKCAHCGKTLVFESRHRRRFYCHNYNMGMGCERATIIEPEFVDTIFTVVKNKLALVYNSEQSFASGYKAKTAKCEVDRRECETRLKKLKLSQPALLEHFLEGKLTKDAYRSQKLQHAEAVRDAAEQLSTLEAAIENTEEVSLSHKPFFDQVTLTREMLQSLIKEICVTSADEVEIVWRFQDYYRSLQESVV